MDERIQTWEKQLGRCYANLARWEQSSVYGRLMAELGVKTNEVLVAWLKKARQEIAAESGLESGETGNVFLKAE